LVVDDPRATQFLGQLLRDDARNRVGRTARRERDNDGHGFFGISRREGGAGQRERGHERGKQFFHEGLLRVDCYCGPSFAMRVASWSISSGLRSVSGARTGPASCPTSLAPAFTMLTA